MPIEHTSQTEPMAQTALSVRQLLVDLNHSFERHWFYRLNGQPDAFRSMYFNALSMSFPAGEQSFIDSVNSVRDTLGDSPEHQRLKTLVRDFIAQEATHRYVHERMNIHLEIQGLTNTWHERIHQRMLRCEQHDPMDRLAITVAYEHYTAVLAELSLTRPELTLGMSTAMRKIWLWHAMEEAEHKAVAFDLYQTLSGHNGRRRYWFARVMLSFMMDSLRQTCRNLWDDGSLLKLSTWQSCLQFFFGRSDNGGGWFWLAAAPLLSFFRADFHPNQQSSNWAAQNYAQENEQDWRVIR